MDKIKQYMSEMTQQGRIAFAGIALLVLLVLTGVIVFYAQNRDAWPLSIFNDSETQLVTEDEDDNSESLDDSDMIDEDKVDPVLVAQKHVNPYAQHNQVNENIYAYRPQEVRIALIIEENEYDVQNIIEGICGNVYMVTAYVPGPALLSNSIKALFGDKVFGDFLPGNIIPSYHPGLMFNDVSIINGVARINLSGNFSGEQDECEATLAIAQLTETTKWYPNVTSIEIYQNGLLVSN